MSGRRKQAVSDLKPGDRRAGERPRALCPAAGVAHSLFPTLAPAARLLLTFRIAAKTTSNGSDRRSDRCGARTVWAEWSPGRSPAFTFRGKYKMPLIQKQKREVKRPMTIKLEESVAERLNSYARFLDSSRDHVVGSIVQYVMDRDKDFAAYLAMKRNGSPDGEGTGGTAVKAGS